MKSFKIAIAQFSTCGQFRCKYADNDRFGKSGQKDNADLIIFPELSTLGYPAEDLLIRPSLAKRTKLAFEKLTEVKDIVMVFGFVNQTEDGERYNSAAVMKDGEVLGFIINRHCQTMVYLMRNAILAKDISIWSSNIWDTSLVF